jgi:hypothetical protein
MSVFLVACNSALDNEDESPSLLTVTGLDPANACVDLDGDGTNLYSVGIDVTISSTIRNASSGSAFNDVVLSDYTVSYDLTNPLIGVNPPSYQSGLTVEVPAGGDATVGVTVVRWADIATYFGPDTRGTVTVRFRGRDLANNPANTVARIPLETGTECQ